MAEISKSLESRVSEFAARTGQEIKKVRGEIATSNTAAEALTQRVAANEGAITNLQSEVAKKVEIDDAQAKTETEDWAQWTGMCNPFFNRED